MDRRRHHRRGRGRRSGPAVVGISDLTTAGQPLDDGGTDRLRGLLAALPAAGKTHELASRT